MRYAKYYAADAVNGPGLRAVLFTQGCVHACRGCYNQTTWDSSKGLEFTKEIEDQIISDLKRDSPFLQGLTLTGGDPLHEDNLKGVLDLIVRVRKECPDKNIWMWTGYTLSDLQESGDFTRLDICNAVDVLVEGKFIQELASPRIRYVGSSNQEVIFLTGK